MITINSFKILKPSCFLKQSCTFRKIFIPTHVRRLGPIGFATPLHFSALNPNCIFLSKNSYNYLENISLQQHIRS